MSGKSQIIPAVLGVRLGGLGSPLEGSREWELSLPRLLGRGRRRLDTGGGRGPSGRRAQSAGRSPLGELVWRLWTNQRRGPAHPRPVLKQARPGLGTPD